MSNIGIDFGTSLNKIGCVNSNNGQNIFKIISNNYKNPSTPCVAFLTPKNSWLFGEKALTQSLTKPEKCISEVKIMLGRKYDDAQFEKRRKYWKFATENDQNNIKIKIKENNKKESVFSPCEIAGLILKNLISISSSEIPSNISKTIISIPVLFNESQINDLLKSAKIAELHGIYFYIDPILASLAYLFNMQADISKKQSFLVYNFGASFLEVSIIKINEGSDNEIITECDESLYGQQFDENVFNYVYKELQEKYTDKSDFLEKKKTQGLLHKACSEAKMILSGSDSTEITLEDEDDDDEDTNSLTFTLTEEKFNEINQELFDKSMNSVDKVVERAKIDIKSIDHLFLVGGSTFIKKIREKLVDKTGKQPCTYADPRESVALGACIIGSALSLFEKPEEERENQAKNSIFYVNLDFFRNLKGFLNFNTTIDYPVDEDGDLVIKEKLISPSSEVSIPIGKFTFSLRSYSSCYSTDFSSVSPKPSISLTNSEERREFGHLWNEKEIGVKKDASLTKPQRISESIKGVVVSCRNLVDSSNKKKFVVVRILKKNKDLKKNYQPIKSKLVENSTVINFDLEFDFVKAKKGNSILVEIFEIDENQNAILIGQRFIPLKEIIENQEYENEFELEEPTNLPNEFKGSQSFGTIKLKLNHKVVYK